MGIAIGYQTDRRGEARQRRVVIGRSGWRPTAALALVAALAQVVVFTAMLMLALRIAGGGAMPVLAMVCSALQEAATIARIPHRNVSRAVDHGGAGAHHTTTPSPTPTAGFCPICLLADDVLDSISLPLAVELWLPTDQRLPLQALARDHRRPADRRRPLARSPPRGLYPRLALCRKACGHRAGCFA